MIDIEEVRKRDEKYRLKFDYHTHTVFSHGKGTVEDNVLVARMRGLKEVAISDHGPGHNFYGIKREALPELRRQVEEMNQKYDDIKVYVSVEANFVHRTNFLDVEPDEYDDYDFVIAGYHYGVTDGDCMWNFRNNKFGKIGLGGDTEALRKRNTDMVVEALYKNDIKILTHPGDKGPFDMHALARACQETGTWMEISSRHEHLNPEEIKICAKYDVDFVISSDAHKPEHVGSFEGALDKAIAAGLDLDRIINLEKIG